MEQLKDCFLKFFFLGADEIVVLLEILLVGSFAFGLIEIVQKLVFLRFTSW